MVNFHAPLIGFIISKDSNRDYFSKTLNLFCADSISDLTQDNFADYIKDDEDVSTSLNLEEDRKMLNTFFKWIEENESLFELKTAYHGGSRNTPVALVLRESKAFPCNEYSSYTMTIEDTERMLKEAKEHKELCRKTMPDNLFSYFEKRGEFGVQYFCCST
jgi:hypothetical protein